MTSQNVNVMSVQWGFEFCNFEEKCLEMPYIYSSLSPQLCFRPSFQVPSYASFWLKTWHFVQLQQHLIGRVMLKQWVVEYPVHFEPQEQPQPLHIVQQLLVVEIRQPMLCWLDSVVRLFLVLFLVRWFGCWHWIHFHRLCILRLGTHRQHRCRSMILELFGHRMILLAWSSIQSDHRLLHMRMHKVWVSNLQAGEDWTGVEFQWVEWAGHQRLRRWEQLPVDQESWMSRVGSDRWPQ